MTSAPTSNPLTTVAWPAAAALGTFALIRPLASITGADELLGKPLTPILLTVIISGRDHRRSGVAAGPRGWRASTPDIARRVSGLQADAGHQALGFASGWARWHRPE